MIRFLITEEWLVLNGWKVECFYFQTGGREDEDDMRIFVKDGIALAYDYSKDIWYLAYYGSLNYAEGFPEDRIVQIH